MGKKSKLSKLDLSGFKEINDRWEDIDNKTIAWGYTDPEEVHEPSGEKIVDIARWSNEGTKNLDGTVHIPRREFMTVSYVLAGYEMDKHMKQLSIGVEKNTVDQALDYIGKELADTIQVAISDFSYPANAPSTIAKKGSDVPLIETGTLMDKAKHKVIEGDV